MRDHEQERIADAMNRLRPDWPTKQLRTLLADQRLAERPRRDVTVALAWVACETASSSPYRVLESGPWWRAASIEAPANPREPFDRSTFCGICGEPRDRCAQRWAGDHEFESVDHAIARHATDDTDVPRVVEALKGQAEPMRERPEAREPAPHTARGDAARTLLHPARAVPGVSREAS